MSTVTDDVATLYAKIADSEGTRLAVHPMERELTLRTILARLPSPSGAVIADIGGGPGRIAFALADAGHLVDLVDLTPTLISMAQREQDHRRGTSPAAPLLRSIAVGNALHPPSPEAEGAYDAVLLLGPLYHLLEESERRDAVSHALRRVRPRSGLVFCAFVSVAAHLRDVAVRDPGKLLRGGDFYHKYLRTGRYESFKEALGVTAQGYHTCAADARAFLQSHFAGEAELVEMRSTEGILGGGLDAKLEEAGPEVVQAWADLMYQEYSTKEEFLGCADHLIAILRRK
ncbi:Methyltransferase type 11 [Cordyceps fumosorosea ARSEF 2679]|uniref:Methyltransferase type 11 n=1 Tax=Cordyceps fumosorosea (strain ARSEF 2679) TaxID=1081104 RepID=A0A167PP45_CORFA|nr:Methyltransferase type 11 [Cordyceps fumosorosea ARSEF 2679]OAA56877.1 Methyltransferase type 11 [Cordyceps fumosorosea ARSEF 2679]